MEDEKKDHVERQTEALEDIQRAMMVLLVLVFLGTLAVLVLVFRAQ